MLLLLSLAFAASPTLTMEQNRLTPAPPATDGAFDEDTVRAITNWMAQKTYVSTLRVEAHIDDGKPEAQARSDKRALALARQLVGAGVACTRLLAVGYGNTMPVAASRSAANTRMELEVAALNGKAIGGMPLDGGGHAAGDACK